MSRDDMKTQPAGPPQGAAAPPPASQKSVDVLEVCDWCDSEERIDDWSEKSEREVFIRRYVGQHGHIISLAFHPACFDQYRDQERLFSRLAATPAPDATQPQLTEARRMERAGILAALRYIAENEPGAALNAAREDEREIAAIVDEIRRAPDATQVAALVRELRQFAIAETGVECFCEETHKHGSADCLFCRAKEIVHV